MTWTTIATALIIISITVAIMASTIYRIVLSPQNSTREMDAIICETLDYRDLSSSQWIKELTNDMNSTNGYPMEATVFVDYVNKRETECEYCRALDYGIAIGYGNKQLGTIYKQISYVFRTESLDGRSDKALTQRENISKRQDAIKALSLGLKKIQQSYNQKNDYNTNNKFELKISPSVISDNAIKYILS